MKIRYKFLLLLTVFLAGALPVFADREPIWPTVGNGPSATLKDFVKEKGNTVDQPEQSVNESVRTAGDGSDDEPIWTNFNTDAVKDGPENYRVLRVKDDEEPVLIQRIRTYHYNSGRGAVPGTISVWEGDTKLGSWQAVGRSAYGTPNIYWEALVDIIMYPGHSYVIKVSDPDSMSYNEASGGSGMFELYGIDPAPEGYVASTWSNPGNEVYTVTYQGNNCLSKVPKDSKTYSLGDMVTILFEPVEYIQGTIFNGWDMNDDGIADFGYNYNTFVMPGKDVELKAICTGQYQDYGQFGVTTGEVDPQYYYNPYNDPGLNGDIYDPATGWWFTPEDYYEYYYGGVG